MNALPTFTDVLLFWLPSFLAGVLVGRYQERHKEELTMNLANGFRAWYDKWAPLMVTAVALLALVGIWIGTSATITNGRQDARDNAATEKVQACFDRYAEAQSASSQAVRDASAAKDVAEAQFNRALNAEGRAFKALTDELLADNLTEKDVQRLRDTLADRDEAGQAVVRAQADLDRARAENPVPEAPSKFCSVKP